MKIIAKPEAQFALERYQILMGVDGDGKVWFRLYAPDAAKLRALLVPGASIALHGVVSTYESSGGYIPVHNEVEFPHESGNEFRMIKDRFQLDVASLELVTITEEKNHE